MLAALSCRFSVRAQDNDGSDFLAPLLGGEADDGGFGDLREGEELALDLEGGDFFAARFDDVDAAPATDEEHGTVGPGLGGVGAGRGDAGADGDVAGLEPRPLAVVVGGGGGEFGRGGGGVAPVGGEDRRAAELDLAFSLGVRGVGGNDLVGVSVDEAGLHGGQGPADGAVDPVGEGEPAGQSHADFGHAVALEEDVAAAKGGPGGFGRRGKGGGAAYVEAQVRGGDAGFGCGLDVRREVRVGGEEARVDCGDDGEEGDGFWFGAVGGEEGGCEAVPDGGGVEREEELDAGSGDEGRDECVDRAVDVVQGEDVEEVVGGCIVPGFYERVRLCGEDGGAEDDTLGA